MTREGAKGSAAFGEAACLGNELEQGLLALLFETEPLPKLATYLAAVQGAIDDRARVDTQVQARNRATSGAGKRSGYDEKSRAFLGMIHPLIPGAGLDDHPGHACRKLTSTILGVGRCAETVGSRLPLTGRWSVERFWNERESFPTGGRVEAALPRDE